MPTTVARNVSFIAILLGAIGLLASLVALVTSLQGVAGPGSHYLLGTPDESAAPEYLRWWYSGVVQQIAQWLLLVGAGVALKRNYGWALPVVLTLLIIVVVDSVRTFVVSPGLLDLGFALTALGALGYSWWGKDK